MGARLRGGRRSRPCRGPAWGGGRRPGEQKALTPRQEALIGRLIVDQCPDQLKLPFALWTREAVGQLIERKTGIRLSLSAISLYLAAWGFTAQKPIRRATERDEAAIRAWLDHDYPAIVKRAKKEKAEIHWADETGVDIAAPPSSPDARRQPQPHHQPEHRCRPVAQSQSGSQRIVSATAEMPDRRRPRSLKLICQPLAASIAPHAPSPAPE